ncbi:MAG: glycoside hydrolase family 6 protein [Gemmatimonadaceae bacterium]
MNTRRFGRTRVVRAVRNSTVAAFAVVAACDAPSATAPSVAENVAEAVNRLAGTRLFVNPADNPAHQQANAWRASRPGDADLMDRMASQPIAKWFGDWSTDIRRDVARVVSLSATQGATPVLVAYNIPNRDCGSYSAGGSASGSAYRQWIRDFAAGLSGQPAVVVLEPDAVAGAGCLAAAAKQERYDLIRDAIQVLKSAHAIVYLDAGNAHWLNPDELAQRLGQAGVGLADGFALNVSNYIGSSVSIQYGAAVSQRVGGKHFIIDTSRNGAGGLGSEWCNVPGQSLGTNPTTNTGNALVDAFLWVKVPGESDGECNGGPHAGVWWAEYALGLAQRGLTVASS